MISKSDCSFILINYMTTNVKSVKLSHDFLIIQHFHLCNLFNKHVFCYFLHHYVTNCSEKRYGSIDHPSQNFNVVN